MKADLPRLEPHAGSYMLFRIIECQHREMEDGRCDVCGLGYDGNTTGGEDWVEVEWRWLIENIVMAGALCAAFEHGRQSFEAEHWSRRSWNPGCGKAVRP